MRPARCGWRATRPGNLVVIVAVCLTVLMAVVALAMDGGNLLDDQRQCQAAALRLKAAPASGDPRERWL